MQALGRSKHGYSWCYFPIIHKASVQAKEARLDGRVVLVRVAPDLGHYLSFTEGEELALLRVQVHGVREIARCLGRLPETVSRELRRNTATRSGMLKYRATVAQWQSRRAAKRSKTAKFVKNDRLQGYLQSRLAGAGA